MAEFIISSELIIRVLALPGRQMWTDYDVEADVLYISFRKPQQADGSVMEEDGNIYHYRDGELVGVTVLNASRKAASAKPTFAELAAWLEVNPPGESWGDIKDDEDAAEYVHRMRRQAAIRLDNPRDDE